MGRAAIAKSTQDKHRNFRILRFLGCFREKVRFLKVRLFEIPSEMWVSWSWCCFLMMGFDHQTHSIAHRYWVSVATHDEISRETDALGTVQHRPPNRGGRAGKDHAEPESQRLVFGGQASREQQWTAPSLSGIPPERGFVFDVVGRLSCVVYSSAVAVSCSGTQRQRARFARGARSVRRGERVAALQLSRSELPILDQYDTIRPILDQYGTIKPILDQYGTIKPILDQYGTIKPILDQYEFLFEIYGWHSFTRFKRRVIKYSYESHYPVTNVSCRLKELCHAQADEVIYRIASNKKRVLGLTEHAWEGGPINIGWINPLHLCPPQRQKCNYTIVLFCACFWVFGPWWLLQLNLPDAEPLNTPPSCVTH